MESFRSTSCGKCLKHEVLLFIVPCGSLVLEQFYLIYHCHNRDYTPPVNLLCDRVARWQLESAYGIRIPPPPEGEEGRPPNAEEFLSSYGLMRGYMTSQGQD